MVSPRDLGRCPDGDKRGKNLGLVSAPDLHDGTVGTVTTEFEHIGSRGKTWPGISLITGGSSIRCRLPAGGLIRRIIFGRYRMKGILPDEYLVLAWEQREAGCLERFPAPGV